MRGGRLQERFKENQLGTKCLAPESRARWEPRQQRGGGLDAHQGVSRLPPQPPHHRSFPPPRRPQGGTQPPPRFGKLSWEKASGRPSFVAVRLELRAGEEGGGAWLVVPVTGSALPVELGTTESPLLPSPSPCRLCTRCVLGQESLFRGGGGLRRNPEPGLCTAGRGGGE